MGCGAVTWSPKRNLASILFDELVISATTQIKLFQFLSATSQELNVNPLKYLINSRVVCSLQIEEDIEHFGVFLEQYLGNQKVLDEAIPDLVVDDCKTHCYNSLKDQIRPIDLIDYLQNILDHVNELFGILLGSFRVSCRREFANGSQNLEHRVEVTTLGGF